MNVWPTGLPRQVWAEETLTIVLSATPVARLNATKAAGSLLVRARLEGGPIRFRYLSAPTTTDGTPLYDADVAEWNGNEIALLAASPGGFIVSSAATANAKLFVTYYR